MTIHGTPRPLPPDQSPSGAIYGTPRAAHRDMPSGATVRGAQPSNPTRHRSPGPTSARTRARTRPGTEHRGRRPPPPARLYGVSPPRLAGADPARRGRGCAGPATRRSGFRLSPLGEIMVTFGLVLLLFAAYEVWGKAAIVRDHQHDLEPQLDQEWEQTPAAHDAGDGGRCRRRRPARPSPGCYIPRLNKHWVVVAGGGPGDIRFAPGPLPEVGAARARSATSPSPGTATRPCSGTSTGCGTATRSWSRPRTTYFVYRVTENQIVMPNAVEVVAPVPDRPGATPTQAMLTHHHVQPEVGQLPAAHRARASWTAASRDRPRAPAESWEGLRECTRGSGGTCRSAGRASSSARDARRGGRGPAVVLGLPGGRAAAAVRRRAGRGRPASSGGPDMTATTARTACAYW